MSGLLSLVSVGPGALDLVPERAKKRLQEAKVIIAYELYLTWIRPLLHSQQIILTPPLTQERQRSALAIEYASQGYRVALVSSGDIGVYAMAGLVFEDLPEDPSFEIEVIPGITAATACGSLLGSPLTHDFATLSLSDLLCPWEEITKRAEHIAASDLACVLYNVQSKGRKTGVYHILNILLRYRSPQTVCGVVRNAYREQQSYEITTLSELLKMEFDMLTTLVIGSRHTLQRGKWMYTPRGYASKKSVWVFSGTSDGNELALELAADHSVVLSVATELGHVLAPEHPNITIATARGKEERRIAMKQAKAIVDATHPYAEKITAQLQELASELGIPYLRYAREASIAQEDALESWVTSLADACELVRGKQVFLATGSKDLRTAVDELGTDSVYVRLTPQPAVIEQALSLGLSPRQICAAIGPFSEEWNVAQWRSWNIEAVITKDSGLSGGFLEKRAAARQLQIPLIVIKRPDEPGALEREAIKAALR